MIGVLWACAAHQFGALFAIHNIGVPVYFTLIFHLLVLVACHVLSALVKGLCQRNNNKVKSFLDPPTTLSNTDIFFQLISMQHVLSHDH